MHIVALYRLFIYSVFFLERIWMNAGWLDAPLALLNNSFFFIVIAVVIRFFYIEFVLMVDGQLKFSKVI